MNAIAIKDLRAYSPPKWGCSEIWQDLQEIITLFPTQVGMFRGEIEAWMMSKPIPHPSGDVPVRVPRFPSPYPYSPPKWGCSVYNELLDLLHRLFPTQVGMFRFKYS